MAIVLNCDMSEMRSRMYGNMHPEAVAVIQQNINNITQRYGEQASWYQQSLQQDFDINVIRPINVANNTLTQSDGLFSERIHLLDDIDEFRLATQINRTYLMANPVVQRAVESGRLEGWGDDLPYRGKHGVDNPLYQKVMQGELVYADESGQEVDRYTYWMNDEVEDEPLSIRDKLIIRRNWRKMESWIEDDGLDPTSPEGAFL